MLHALREKAIEPDLTQEMLLEDWPVVVARIGHPLAASTQIDAAALAAYPWIMPSEETPLRILWRNVFDRVGVTRPRVPIECGSVITVGQLLLRGDFLTTLSPAKVAVELGAGWLIQLGRLPGELSRRIGITTRADWRPTPMK